MLSGRKNTGKVMRKFCFLAGMLITANMALSGQDPQFTQFYAAPVYLSPSFAGSAGVTRVILNFRDQWPKLPGDYVTYALSVDGFIEKYSSGVGLLLFRDQAAGSLINSTNVGLNYNYNFSVSRKWKLSPGIQVYYYWKNIDYANLVFSDQISRDYTNPVSIELEQLMTTEPIHHLDVTTSLLAYSKNTWGGITIDHMLSLNKSLKSEDGYLPLRVSMYGGTKYFLSGRTRQKGEKSVTAAFNLMLQDKYKYLDLGLYYTRLPLLFGVWYRGMPVFPDCPNVGALTVQFGYSNKNISIGYSYDYTVSTLITKTGGAHEISLAVKLQAAEKKRKMRMIPCPTL
jgi:type IX secretion system PorP/SprF family membrane protein